LLYLGATRFFGGPKEPRYPVDVHRAAAAAGAGEGDAAARLVDAAGGYSLDVRGVARGADEWTPVPVRGDQDQGFGCAVFLDPPTSHGHPLRELAFRLPALDLNVSFPTVGTYNGEHDRGVI
jgi:hypothetical protein